MTGIAVGLNGTPLGVPGQTCWTRKQAARRTKNDRRPVKEKETQKWLDVTGQVREVLGQASPATVPWFQMDRGADCWPVLLETQKYGLLTVRAVHDRRLVDRFEGQPDRLFARLEREPAPGECDLEVPAGPG